MTWRVEPLHAQRHDRTTFSSGVDSFDRYLATQATQDARRVSATFCLVDDQGPGAVAGFYTLAVGAVRLTGLPPEVQKRLPRYPDVPVYLLGRLAVDTRWRGEGLGSLLLRDAFRRVVHQEVPAWAVVVDAMDDSAARFYQRHGFKPFPHQPRRLLLPMTAIAKASAPTERPPR